MSSAFRQIKWTASKDSICFISNKMDSQELKHLKKELMQWWRYRPFTKIKHVKEKAMILKKKYKTLGKFKASVGWISNVKRELGLVKEKPTDTFINTKLKKWLDNNKRANFQVTTKQVKKKVLALAGSKPSREKLRNFRRKHKIAVKGKNGKMVNWKL